MRLLHFAAVVVALFLASVASAEAMSFSYTGGEQSVVVPAGMATASVSAEGGPAFNPNGGKPAIVTGTIPVTPGTTLYVEVGGSGSEFGAAFNGGGSGGSPGGGIGGAGASDVRTVPGTSTAALNSRLIVAAGGGAIGASAGGDADGSAPVDDHSGAPGTTTGAGAGGNGGPGGCSGTPGVLGQGGTGCNISTGFGGGGGGGGLYGGGGGGMTSGGDQGGGGGGSSLVPDGGTRGLAAAAQTAVAGVTIEFHPPTTITPPPGTGTDPGTGTGTGTGTKDTIAPTVSIFTLSPSSFVAANSGPATTAKTVGTRLNFKLSEDATMKLTVARKTTGHKKKVGKKTKCVSGTRKHGTCTLYESVGGSATYAGKSGLNTFRFMGRLANKSLKPGGYRLSLEATDAAGNKSKTLTKSFTIKKP